MWRLLLFASGSLFLIGFISWLIVRTALMLQMRKGVALPFNPLLHPAEMLFRLGMIMLSLLLILVSGMPLDRFGIVSLDPQRDLVGGGLFGIGMAWSVNLLSFKVIPHLGRRWYSSQVILLMRPRTHQEIIPVILAALPAAALEELLLRAIGIGGFSLWIGPSWLILLSALLFGLLHLAQGYWGVIMAMLMGLVLGFLFVKTGSLWFVLMAHWSMNANQFVLAYFKPEVFDERWHT